MTSPSAKNPAPNPSHLPGPVALLVLFAAVACVYAGTVGAEFLNFDDNLFFGPDNPAFRSAWEQGSLRPVLGERIANAWLPLSHLSLYVDYLAIRLFGAGPGFAHAHSVLLHALAAFLLARLSGRLGLSRPAATVVALLFAVHPALAESVAWVSGRKDVLSGLAAFAALGAVVRHAERPRLRTAVAAIAWAVVALYAKGTTVVLAGLAPLLAWTAGGRPRSGMGAAWGVALAALAAGAHHAVVAAAEQTMVAADPFARVGQVPGAVWHYLRTVFWPSELNVLYPTGLTLERFRAAFWPGLAALAVWVAGAFASWRLGYRLVGAGLLAGLLALAPFNTAFPASSIAAADRYLYLVLPWLALAAAAGLRRIAPWAGAAIAVVLAVVAWDRAADFRSSRALWESSLACEPRNAVAALNLAYALPAEEPRRLELARRAARVASHPSHELRARLLLVDAALGAGREQEARAELDRAVAAARRIEAARDRLTALLLVAAARRSLDGERAAADLLEEAAAIDPEHPAVLVSRANLRLGELLGSTGRLAPRSPEVRALREMLERALARDPDHYEARFTLARLEQGCGNLTAAYVGYRRALRAAPDRPEAYLALAALQAEAGRLDFAETTVREGLARRPAKPDPRLQVRLAEILAARGELAEAVRYYEGYLRMRPTDRDARRALAHVLASEAMGRMWSMTGEALAARARRVRELDPNQARGWLLEGAAMRKQRRWKAAIEALERARSLAPDDPDVRRLLAETYRDYGYLSLARDATRESALDALRRFVDTAPEDLDTESALGVLRAHWKRAERAGVRAFLNDDLDAAERAFRRCLRLLPKETSAYQQLGLVLLRRGGSDRLAEALECFERAEQGQRARGGDPSLPRFYQVLCLRRLGRADEARRRARAFLESLERLDESARTAVAADVVDRIRVQLRGIDAGRAPR